MSAAAPPPTPLKAATIWGIAVIWTLWAETAPTHRAEQDADPDHDRPQCLVEADDEERRDERHDHADGGEVLPERAVSGVRRRRMPTMNSAAAAR